MTRLNPLLVGALRARPTGLVGGRLGYLLLQAAALLLWWPWSGMSAVLATGSPPRALAAVVVALGLVACFDGVRAGAEESLAPGQHPLREWVVGTPLPLGRVLRGWLLVQLLQLAYLLALSAPLLLVAFSVAGVGWPTLARALLTVVPLALFYRLAGAVAYELLGHRTQSLPVLLRGFVVLSWALAPLLVPAASHLLVVPALLLDGAGAAAGRGALTADAFFATLYGCLAVALGATLYLLLRRYRRREETSMARQPAAPGGRR